MAVEEGHHLLQQTNIFIPATATSITIIAAATTATTTAATTTTAAAATINHTDTSGLRNRSFILFVSV